jgi:hypothetical protein
MQGTLTTFSTYVSTTIWQACSDSLRKPVDEMAMNELPA